jgi:hypothetical protein
MTPTYYPGDPYWITARWRGVCKGCGCMILPGDKAFFFPRGKEIFCMICGREECNSFEASVEYDDSCSSQVREQHDVYDYYQVVLPSEVSEDPEERQTLAILNAQQRARFEYWPSLWAILADDGNNIKVRRIRCAHTFAFDMTTGTIA